MWSHHIYISSFTDVFLFISIDLSWQDCPRVLSFSKTVSGGKSNYSPFSFSLGPICEHNMNEIDFSPCATKSRFWSIFEEKGS